MKIAIIGAGSCGLYLAYKLAKRGYEVTVFEKKDKLSNKACSGLFSERILDFIPQSQKLIENKINSVIVNFPKKKSKVDFSKGFLVMDHSKLDNLIMDLAINAGAKISFNQHIKEAPVGFDKVIACDGAESEIRKKLKLKKPSLRLGIQGFTAPCDTAEERETFVETWPCKNGFLWKIPRGKNIEYGVLTNINDAYKTFTEFIKKNKINILDIRARVVPQGFITTKDEEIALCGDAAGLTKPWSGGGVIWGMLAADILVKTFPDFSKYEKELKKFFGFKILKSKLFTKAVYFVGYRIPFLLPKHNKIDSDFLI